eukprot:m.96640 g.96640  ORF g.96640 m.96640 type:complete len:116 (+) comp10177_c0_seq2:183-530(+)
MSSARSLSLSQSVCVCWSLYSHQERVCIHALSHVQTYEGHKTRVHRSVLEWWVVHCDVAPIKLLVEAGADLSFEDEEGFTVLARAKRAGKRCDRVVDYIEEILQNDAASSSKDDL